MKTSLSDLNEHLFNQLDRLSKPDMDNEQIQNEIIRTEAITSISKTVIANATLQLDAAKLKAEYQGLKEQDLPRMLLGSNP